MLARLPLRSPSDFGLVFTSSVQGSIKPCGCTARPLGGVARLGTAIARLRAHYGENLLFVDAGDLLFEKKSPRPAVEKCQDDARIEVLLSSYKSFGVVQTVQGERDAANGADAYQTWLEDHQIHHGDAAIATTLQRVGAREIGLVSVRAEGEWAEQKIKLEAAMHHLKRQKVAHTVVLSQLSLEQLRAIQWPASEGTVILQGRDPGEAPKKPLALGENGPWVIFNGIQGQYLGVLHYSWPASPSSEKISVDLSFFNTESDKRVLNIRAKGLAERIKRSTEPRQKTFLLRRLAEVEKSLRALEQPVVALPEGPALRIFSYAIVPELKAAPEIEDMVKDYENQIPALVSSCEANATCPEPEEGDAVYVGVQTCQGCHAEAVAHWQKRSTGVRKWTTRPWGTRALLLWRS